MIQEQRYEYSERDQKGITEKVVRSVDESLRKLFIDARIEERLKDVPDRGWIIHRPEGARETIIFALNIDTALIAFKKVKSGQFGHLPIRAVIARFDKQGMHYIPYETIFIQ